MKRLLHIVLLMLVVAACTDRGRHNNAMFMWKPAGAEFDSITELLERAYCFNGDRTSILGLTLRLDSLARADSADGLKRGRALFFRARYADAYDSRGKALTLIDSARACYTDSASNAYDIFRIRYTRAMQSDASLTDDYFAWLGLLKDSRRFNDSVITAASMTNLGSIFLLLGDSATAAGYYSNAIDIFSRLGMDDWARKFSLSLSAAGRSANPARSDSIDNALLHDPALANDSDFYNKVLLTKYLVTGDIGYIRRAYPLVAGNTVARTLYDMYLARTALDADSPQVALRLTRGVLRRSGWPDKPLNSESVCRTAALAMEHYGSADTALMLMHNLEEIIRVNAEERISSQIYRNQSQLEIEKMEREIEARHRSERMRTLMLALLLFIAVAAAVALLIRRSARIERLRRATALENTRQRQRLASSSIIIAEKDNTIENVIHTIDKIKDEGGISANDAAKVNNSLKLHLSNNDELKSFKDIFDKLDTDFTRRLFERHQNLSESQLRLSAYIAMGMSNKHIARVMTIDYKSVLTARHRLRTRLDLPKDISLDSYLRNFVSE